MGEAVLGLVEAGAVQSLGDETGGRREGADGPCR